MVVCLQSDIDPPQLLPHQARQPLRLVEGGVEIVRQPGNLLLDGFTVVLDLGRTDVPAGRQRVVVGFDLGQRRRVAEARLPAKTVTARVTNTETSDAIPMTVVITTETTVTAEPSTDNPATDASDNETVDEGSTASAEATFPSTTAVKRQTYSGCGDDVVDVALGTDYRVLTFTCSGCSGNTVLTADGDDGLLVNVVGNYTGRHLVNVEGALTRLKVTADSHWTLTLDPINVLAADKNRSQGHGDDVVYVDKGSKTAFSHNGEDNFAVFGVAEDGRDLLINEIGSYHGTVGLNTPEILIITADGDWTITQS